MRFAAWPALALGVAVVATWVVSLAGGSVPEVRAAPTALAFHLAAEGIMAAALLVAAVGLLHRAA